MNGSLAVVPRGADLNDREPRIDWTYAARIPPGDYPAVSRNVRVYFDKQFKRWVCAVQFDIVTESLMEKIARVAWFLNLGTGMKARAGRRSKYWAAWVRAKGGAPQRGDRLSPSVFTGRHAIVRVEDTSKSHDRDHVDPQQAYSVVRDVVSWETGGYSSRLPINKSFNQPSRQASRKCLR